jgi:uncharacterized protein (TIGR02996 family)
MNKKILFSILEDIVKNPEEKVARMAYADYLDEYGDEDARIYSKFIKINILDNADSVVKKNISLVFFNNLNALSILFNKNRFLTYSFNKQKILFFNDEKYFFSGGGLKNVYLRFKKGFPYFCQMDIVDWIVNYKNIITIFPLERLSVNVCDYDICYLEKFIKNKKDKHVKEIFNFVKNNYRKKEFSENLLTLCKNFRPI